jgi:hypothetical protein
MCQLDLYIVDFSNSGEYDAEYRWDYHRFWVHIRLHMHMWLIDTANIGKLQTDMYYDTGGKNYTGR